MPKQKLLIISYSAGAGHVRAAEAVRKTALSDYPNMDVRHIDFIQFASLPMKTAVVNSYDLLIKQAPDLWGFFYHQTNKPTISKYLKKITNLMKNINTDAFVSELESFKPDYILFTHFIPADIYVDLAEKAQAPVIPFGTVITDYGLHELWVTSSNQDYFVPTKKMQWQIISRGIPKKQVVLSGIPVDPEFYKKKSRAIFRKKMHLAEQEKTILCLSGGQGLTHLDDVVRILFDSPEPINIIAVAGNNERLYKKLLNMAMPKHIRINVLGWVDTMDEYMRAADVIVSKLGGMTTSECITLGVPLIGIDPIPGQEEHNTQFILEEQHGAIARTTEDLLYYVLHIPTTRAPLRVVAAKKILKYIDQAVSR